VRHEDLRQPGESAETLPEGEGDIGSHPLTFYGYQTFDGLPRNAWGLPCRLISVRVKRVRREVLTYRLTLFR